MEFPESLPRSVVVITGIVAIIAVSFGVKDYLDQQQKKAKAPAVTSSSNLNDSDAVSAQKKKTKNSAKASAKARGARASATESNVILEKSAAANAGTKAADEAAANLSDDERAQAAADEVQAAMDQNNRARTEPDIAVTAAQALSAAQCLPLPNGTKLGDVDAPYYKGWAREYSCLVWP